YAERVLPEALTARALRFDHVRAVLAAVAHGGVDAGVVYATDAAREPRVRTAEVLLDEGIVYPAAVLAGAPAEAHAVARHLCSPAARAALTKAGFGPPP
ncbi:MAG: molybdate ABC transporter substrate-binding protein, partial [Deltaproteobacteria bacterium]